MPIVGWIFLIMTGFVIGVLVGLFGSARVVGRAIKELKKEGIIRGSQR